MQQQKKVIILFLGNFSNKQLQSKCHMLIGCDSLMLGFFKCYKLWVYSGILRHQFWEVLEGSTSSVLSRDASCKILGFPNGVFFVSFRAFCVILILGSAKILFLAGMETWFLDLPSPPHVEGFLMKLRKINSKFYFFYVKVLPQIMKKLYSWKVKEPFTKYYIINLQFYTNVIVICDPRMLYFLFTITIESLLLICMLVHRHA